MCALIEWQAWRISVCKWFSARVLRFSWSPLKIKQLKVSPGQEVAKPPLYSLLFGSQTLLALVELIEKPRLHTHCWCFLPNYAAAVNINSRRSRTLLFVAAAFDSKYHFSRRTQFVFRLFWHLDWILLALFAACITNACGKREYYLECGDPNQNCSWSFHLQSAKQMMFVCSQAQDNWIFLFAEEAPPLWALVLWLGTNIYQQKTNLYWLVSAISTNNTQWNWFMKTIWV